MRARHLLIGLILVQTSATPSEAFLGRILSRGATRAAAGSGSRILSRIPGLSRLARPSSALSSQADDLARLGSRTLPGAVSTTGARSTLGALPRVQGSRSILNAARREAVDGSNYQGISEAIVQTTRYPRGIRVRVKPGQSLQGSLPADAGDIQRITSANVHFDSGDIVRVTSRGNAGGFNVNRIGGGTLADDAATLADDAVAPGAGLVDDVVESGARLSDDAVAATGAGGPGLGRRVLGGIRKWGVRGLAGYGVWSLANRATGGDTNGFGTSDPNAGYTGYNGSADVPTTPPSAPTSGDPLGQGGYVPTSGDPTSGKVCPTGQYDAYLQGVSGQ